MVAERTKHDSLCSSEASDGASIGMRPAHNALGVKDAVALSNAVLSSSTLVGEHSREEMIVSMLGSHPWTAADGAFINIVNERGQNLAHLCAQLGYNQLLLNAIEWGIDIRAEDVNGWTPLDFARLHVDERAIGILEGDTVDLVQYKNALQVHDMPHDPITASSIDRIKSDDIESAVPSPSPANKLAAPLIPFKQSSTPGNERLPGESSRGGLLEPSVSAGIEL